MQIRYFNTEICKRPEEKFFIKKMYPAQVSINDEKYAKEYLYYHVLLYDLLFFQVEVLVLILYIPEQGQNYLLDIGNLSHQNLPSHLK